MIDEARAFTKAELKSSQERLREMYGIEFEQQRPIFMPKDKRKKLEFRKDLPHGKGWGFKKEANAKVLHEIKGSIIEEPDRDRPTVIFSEGWFDGAQPPEPKEMVNHPVHYNSHPSGIECIDIVEHFDFNVGNAIKYAWRAGLKGEAIEDLEKAQWYIKREIEKIKSGPEPMYAKVKTDPA